MIDLYSAPTPNGHKINDDEFYEAYVRDLDRNILIFYYYDEN